MRFGGQQLAQRWATAWAGVLPRPEVTGPKGRVADMETEEEERR
jgi:hypothetical protein